MKLKFFFLFISSALLVGLAAFFLLDKSTPEHFSSNVNADTSDNTAYILPVAESNVLPLLNSSVPAPEISARAFIAYDIKSSKALLDKNTELKLPIASLTKILSAIVVLENASQSDIVTVGAGTVRVDAEKQTLYAGEKISVENLLKLMLIESSNDAAYTLADYVQKNHNIDFVQKMNEKALSLGMYDSYFMDPAGLNDDAYSTPSDLIKLVKYSLSYDKIWSFSTQKEITLQSVDGDIVHTIKNTNQLLGVIPGIIGGKTGNTDRAKGCLILVLDISGNSDTIITVVLGSDDRFSDTQKIVDWARTAYRWK